MRVIIVLLFLLALPVATAINASGGNYTVPLFTTSLSGGELNSSNYTGRYSFTTSPVAIGSGGGYEGTVGFLTALATASPTNDSNQTVDIPSGGGGGGGGAEFADLVLSETPAPVRLSLQTSRDFTVGTHSHRVTIKRIVNKVVTFLFESEPLEVEVAEGEEKEVDLDADTVNDILIRVIKVDQAGADFEMEELEEQFEWPTNETEPEPNETIIVAPPEETAPEASTGSVVDEIETPVEAPEKSQLRMILWMGLIAAFIIVAVLAFIFEKKRQAPPREPPQPELPVHDSSLEN